MQQMQVSQSAGPLRREVFYYEGSDTLYGGYALCRNFDYGTAATAEPSRMTRVEKPSATNIRHFAGIVPQTGKSYVGPCEVPLLVPDQSGLVNGYTTENCTINATLLTVVPGSYKLGGLGEGVVVGRAMQTVNRSSTNGLVLMQLLGNVLGRQRIASAAGAGPSPVIWDTCPWAEAKIDPTIGIALFDKFLTFGARTIAAAASTAQVGIGYDSYLDILASLTDAGLPRGGMKVACNGDNLLAVIAASSAFMAAGQATYVKPWWFEASVLFESIANDNTGAFIGLYEPGVLATNVPLADDDSLAVKDLVGFYRNAADGDALDTVIALNGGAVATVKADAVTLVAGAPIKVGMRWDGTTLRFYADGVVLADTALASATNFPNEQILAPCFAVNQKGSTAKYATIEWWRAFQLL